MIYQTVFTFGPLFTSYPADAGIGYDRLSYSHEDPSVRQQVASWIQDGKLDQYFGPHDSVTYFSDKVETKTAWKSELAAQEGYQYIMNRREFFITPIGEIVAIPE